MTVRVPKQERGERTAELILDATARLLAEGGLESLSLLTIAERAGVSRASVYHFYGDLEGVLSALHERHRSALREAGAATGGAEEQWAGASPWEAASLYLAPVVEYLERHPDFLVLARHRPPRSGTPRYELFLDRAERMLRARDRVPSQQIGPTAAGITAIAVGMLQFALRSDVVPRAVMLEELHRALAAYLDAAEDRI